MLGFLITRRIAPLVRLTLGGLALLFGALLGLLLDTQALALLGEHAGPVHLLFTDVVMPGRSGRELADALQLVRPTAAVLFMSGYTEDTVLQHGIARGEVQFLAKPFSAGEVVSAVGRVLERSTTPRAETAG